LIGAIKHGYDPGRDVKFKTVVIDSVSSLDFIDIEGHVVEDEVQNETKTQQETKSGLSKRSKASKVKSSPLSLKK